MCDRGQINWSEPKPITSPEKAAAEYERLLKELVPRLAKVDEATWNKKIPILVGGQKVHEGPFAAMCWEFIFDAVHHRGQLSVYIRPMGGKVPSIYGPSADDTGK